MSYTEHRDNIIREPAVINPVVDYHDRVRWGPIIGGIFIAIATQLILSALAAAIGLVTALDAPGVGIWTIINLFISLFIGSWVMARTCGPMNKKTAMLNGAILWATTLGLSAWLLASGVSGTFGVVAANAGEVVNQVQQGAVNPPNVNQAQIANRVEDAATKAAWGFVIGSLFGLASSLIGASIGARHPRTHA